jgi:uncharacterized protein YndB with AHSA1/START domain
MGHIEASRDLSASPEAIWATVANPNTWGEWFAPHDKWMEEPPATLTQGATLSAKIVMLGMANKIDWAVESVEAPSRLVLSGTGMAGVKATFEFTIAPEGTGSRFTVAGDFQGALVKGALAKAVEKDGVKQLDKSIEALDALASAAV